MNPLLKLVPAAVAFIAIEQLPSTLSLPLLIVLVLAQMPGILKPKPVS